MPPSRYTRRSALRLGSLGIVSAVTGCLSASDDEPASPPTSNETSSPSETTTSISRTLSMGETATSSAGVSVTISAPQVRKIIYTPDVDSIAHSYPAGTPDSQFLTVSISAQGKNFTTLRLAPVIDETRFESQLYRHSHTPGGSGLLGFQVPIIQTRSGAIEWQPSAAEQYRWELPESVVSDLGSSPRFSVKQFDAPDSIERGDRFTAHLTVTNTGDRDGRFLAVVLSEGPSSVPLVNSFTVPVPMGETATRDISGREVEVERSSMTAILDWGITEQRDTFSIPE